MESNKKKTVTFLFGAGAEKDLGLPSGSDFKKDIVLGENAETIYRYVNEDSENTYKIKDGFLLSWNSYHTLYQTLSENDSLRNMLTNDERKIFEEYERINQNSEKNIDIKKDITVEFNNLYKTLVYEKIKSNELGEFQNEFLKCISMCHFLDSRLNSLRLPENYKKETGKVLRILYSAFCSIYKGIDGNFPFDDVDIPVKERREKLFQAIENGQDIIVKNAKNNSELYYNIIKEKVLDKNYDCSVITTNYTNFAEKLMGLNETHVAYIHGRLDIFEDIESKIAKPITEFESDKKIMPFLFVPSGVKPVVNSWQIEQYAKACDWIKNSDYLVVLGYGLNSDDEHVINFLRERMLDTGKAKHTLFFYNSDKTKITKHMGNDINTKKIDNVEKDLMEFIK